jgi:transcription factor E2F7/8
MSRSNSFIPHHPPENQTTTTLPSEKPYARAQSETTLVTPTPKKAKSDPQAAPAKAGPGYSRKKKSLGILAENFLKTYQNLPRGSIVIVDEAAIKLGVERRRIYDVVNILESISLVCKKHKNTYTWMGMDHLDAVFGRMQAEALEEHPEDAKEFLGVTGLTPREPPPKPLKGREFKSLARLSQDFLQIFLVGHKTLSLPDASDKIQGTTSMEELVAMGQKNKKFLDEKELKAAAARGLKTKIRRLYDIANVFLSVGLLEKVDGSDATRRPNFSWAYRLSAKQIYDLHQPTDKNEKGEPNSKEEDSTSNARMVVSTPPSSHQQQPHGDGNTSSHDNISSDMDASRSTGELQNNLKTTDTILSPQEQQPQQIVLAVTPCSSTNPSANSSPFGCEGHVAV